MSYDLQALTDAAFARLATDAAGSALRALLPDGADGIISADRLAETVIGQSSAPPPLPRPPFVALRQGAAPLTDRIAYLPRYTWFVYGARSAGVGAINPVIALLLAAYDQWDPAGLGVGSVECSPQAPTVDRVLGLWVLPVTLDLSTI